MTSSVLNRIAKWHMGTIGNFLEQRSNGIKDLRLGSMLEEDWNPKPGTVPHPEGRAPVPPLPRIAYHILIGTLTKDEKSLMATYFGDGLVTPHSAVGATLFKISHVKVFVRTGHNSILNNRQVYHHVRKVLLAG